MFGICPGLARVQKGSSPCSSQCVCVCVEGGISKRFHTSEWGPVVLSGKQDNTMVILKLLKKKKKIMSEVMSSNQCTPTDFFSFFFFCYGPGSNNRKLSPLF